MTAKEGANAPPDDARRLPNCDHANDAMAVATWGGIYRGARGEIAMQKIQHAHPAARQFNRDRSAGHTMALPPPVTGIKQFSEAANPTLAALRSSD